MQLIETSKMKAMLLSWQQQLMNRLIEADSCVSCWYVAPQTGIGKTWMTHYLGDTRGSLNTYPLNLIPITHTIKAVKHYVQDNCNCGNSDNHRFENRRASEPITQTPNTQKIVVFDIHTGCRLKNTMKRMCPCLTSSHVIVFTDNPPDKDTLTLRDWEIVKL